jgi:hypothetical protein
MKLPNKVTPYKKSILAKFPIVLLALQKKNMTPAALYKQVKYAVENTSELANILSCLYALNKVDFINEEMLCYVEDDTM